MGVHSIKKRILIIVLATFILFAIVYYFTPKTFGKGVDAADVDHINVFDGHTGVGFTIDNPKDVKYIIENIQSKSMKRDGISLGHLGYFFSISYVDGNGKEIVPMFFLNEEDTIRKDPFFYSCVGGLCVDFILEQEDNITESASEARNEKALLSYRYHSDIADFVSFLKMI